MYIVVDLVGLISAIIGGLVILGVLIYSLIKTISNKFKNNCFECKNYELYNVSSIGSWCWHNCKKTNIKDENTMNGNRRYRKCNLFEKE